MAPAAHAEKADIDKHMFAEADDARFDDLNQVKILSGHVVVTKGTQVMRGARLELREDPQGNQFGTLTAEPGKKAFFRQKREVADEFIEAEAQTIEYDGKADTIKFVQGAELRRYQGATLSGQLTAELIVYDAKTDVFTGSGKKSGADPTTGGRVRIMLTPKNAASAPVGDASPAPALRPSTSLSGDKK
jgi:lipopolysaccharide export system protein LptA